MASPFLAALVLGLAACTTAGSPAPGSPSAGDGSAAALARTLAAGGVDCADVAPRTPSTYVADAARCSIGSDDVIVRTFSGVQDRDRFIEASGKMAAQASVDAEAPPQLVGPTWIITTDTEATAEKIRDVLGGEIR